MTPEALWLVCGVLQAEMEYLRGQGRIKGSLLFLESMLHMNPDLLEEKLVLELEKTRKSTLPVVLVYGDCSYHLVDLAKKYRVGRVNAINCAQMLLGRQRYRELMQAQSFIFLPEWAPRWKQILNVELGLSQGVARDLMGENRRELVYLDTGLKTISPDWLDECARYLGLSIRTERVSLDNLALLLEDALVRREKP